MQHVSTWMPQSGIAARYNEQAGSHCHPHEWHRHWMPKRSDCPYPGAGYTQTPDVATFEHFQRNVCRQCGKEWLQGQGSFIEG